MLSSAFSPYARILATPGALAFSATGLVARIPISTVSLGIVLLVSQQTGSYGLAGAISAVYVLANALLAVVHGRLADRLGQARALGPAIVVFGVAGIAVVVTVTSGAPTWTTYAAAAVAGGALPQVGSCVRARWAHVLRGDAPGVQTAFALEAVVDEAVFITGPIIVTFLATLWHPAAGILTAVVTGLVGTLALTAQRRTQPPVTPHDASTGARPPLPLATMAALTALCFGLGSIFGAAEVATVAFAEEQDAKAWAGVLLALWALGSLAAGVVVGAVVWRVGPAVRMRWSAAALTLAMAPLIVAPSVWVLGLVLLVAGAAISPTLISTMSLIEQAAPRERVTEAMAVLHTGMAAGIAPGAALAGLCIDTWGAHAAYVVPVVSGVIAVTAAWLAPAGDTRSEPVPSEVPAP
ncbi:MFS family permease [Nocardioides zeae]|uniref:MFS family permease n=1 Tax=Nocardioides zeae TaxID=1457234 RepID=A0ACC6IM49_9ACTN|nr:MFS transporter [Nocardioides zeae]MDR6175981.1 MFS family permease [Nocardioides zeae]MDR6211722.1 MFS family permease [Nocardioides zeae]